MKKNKMWTYKKYCSRCGELGIVRSKYAHVCVECVEKKQEEIQESKKENEAKRERQKNNRIKQRVQDKHDDKQTQN